MLFGDAKQSMDSISSCLEDSQDRFTVGAQAAEQQHQVAVAVEDLPEARKVIGVLRERLPGEQRVSFAPSSVPKLRRLGFGVLLEAGAGALAGFSDEDYTRHGGVQVAESSVEVLKQADVIFKVSEPLLDEVQVLQGTQTWLASERLEAVSLLLGLGWWAFGTCTAARSCWLRWRRCPPMC